MKSLVPTYGGHLCLRRCRLPQGIKNVCVPHTPYPSVLKFVPFAGRVYGVATHAVGGDAGYSLLADYHKKYNKMLHWHESGNNPYGLN